MSQKVYYKFWGTVLPPPPLLPLPRKSQSLSPPPPSFLLFVSLFPLPLLSIIQPSDLLLRYHPRPSFLPFPPTSHLPHQLCQHVMSLCLCQCVMSICLCHLVMPLCHIISYKLNTTIVG
jgi:hypothetical protein